MNFSSAQREFRIRYYQWAAGEWEQEIDQSFLDLQLFEAGSAWKAFHFMQRLDKTRQLLLARSLLKRFHPEAVKALNETCSVEENALRNRFDDFRRNSSELDVQSMAERRLKNGSKVLAKRKLLEEIERRFNGSFGNQCSKSGLILKGDIQVEFKMACSGWEVFTHFWFGRRESLIDYSHAIANQTLAMGSMMSYCSWLGISSQTQLENLTIANLDSACEAILKHCGRFYKIAPMLLSGLEFDKIIGE